MAPVKHHSFPEVDSQNAAHGFRSAVFNFSDCIQFWSPGCRRKLNILIFSLINCTEKFGTAKIQLMRGNPKLPVPIVGPCNRNISGHFM